LTNRKIFDKKFWGFWGYFVIYRNKVLMV